MSVLALTMPTGEPLSWLAATVVALGVVGLLVGTVLRVKRRA
ncbi:MAG TPA: hypothetical protein VFQ77_11330 [Pseudonocardiaceae bacterium]|jgi:hypothetical protein|nr:hypothetical protein [Pseudonocardiaceae bacterium]